MKEKLFLIGFILAIILMPSVHAENEVPQIVLNQWSINSGSLTSENDSCSLDAYVIYCHSPDKKLTDWRLSSEEQAEEIARNFIKNRQDIIGVLTNDLKIEDIIFSAQKDYDHYNPSATAVYKQYYYEIPAFYGAISISVNAYGTIWSVTKKDITTNITAPTTPIITSTGVIEIAEETYNQSTLELEKEPELFIFENKLVWRLNILRPIFKEVMIDSQTGEIVLERKNIRDEGASGLIRDITNPKSSNLIYYITGILIILFIAMIFWIKYKKKSSFTGAGPH